MAEVTETPAPWFDRPTSWEVQSDWPTTSQAAIWLYDTDHPSILDLSIVSAASDDEHTSLVYVANCPSDSCPDDDWVPQTITSHTRLMSREGERTEDGTTTYWECHVESTVDCTETGCNEHDPFRCAVTTGVDIERPRPDDATTTHDFCFWHQRSVAVSITAGMDELYKVQPYNEREGDMSSILGDLELKKSVACPTGVSGSPSSDGTRETSSLPEETGTAFTTETEGSGTETGDAEDATETDGSVRLSLSSAMMMCFAVFAIINVG